jgi:hypothetical protein
MFDSLKSVVGGLNIFDLREPAGFRFCSIHGFAVYLLSYVLVIIYDSLFTNECIHAITSGWQGIAGKCGLTAGAVIFPFVYMFAAFVVINAVRRADWSADAVFNNLSLLIVTQAVATGIFYQFGFAAIIQRLAGYYFIVLGCLGLAVLGGLSLLAERHKRPPKWTLSGALRASPGIYRLLTIYVVLSTAFFLIPFGIKFNRVF